MGGYADSYVFDNRGLGRIKPRICYVKFFLYTLLGSLLMLIALLYLYGETGGFSIESMHKVKLDILEQKLIFFAFLLAFAVKVPMWPVHTWLPDARRSAYRWLGNFGSYNVEDGWLWFYQTLFTHSSRRFRTFTLLMVVLSLIAIVYIGFVALVQTDMKKLIAYLHISYGVRYIGFLFGFLGSKLYGKLE